MMTDAQLHEITSRAELFTNYGDRFALSAEDVSALVDEVRRCRANERHLIALTRQHLDALNRIEQEAGEIVYAHRGNAEPNTSIAAGQTRPPDTVVRMDGRKRGS
jgi:hypothetical protein